MVVMIWVQIGYPVVIFMAALQRVDPELYEAAELDGADWFQRFRRDHRAADPARDLRRHADLHDRRAQGVRADLRPHGRRPGHGDHRARVLRLQRVLPDASRSATARPSPPCSPSSSSRSAWCSSSCRTALEQKEEEPMSAVSTRPPPPLDASVEDTEAGHAPGRGGGRRKIGRRLGRAARGDPARPAHARAVPAHPHQRLQVAGRLQHVGPADACRPSSTSTASRTSGSASTSRRSCWNSVFISGSSRCSRCCSRCSTRTRSASAG